MSGFGLKGVAAFPADHPDLSFALGHPEGGLAGGAFEKAILLPLPPHIPPDGEKSRNLPLKLEISGVFPLTLIDISGKGSEITVKQ